MNGGGCGDVFKVGVVRWPSPEPEEIVVLEQWLNYNGIEWKSHLCM